MLSSKVQLLTVALPPHTACRPSSRAAGVFDELAIRDGHRARQACETAARFALTGLVVEENAIQYVHGCQPDDHACSVREVVKALRIVNPGNVVPGPSKELQSTTGPSPLPSMMVVTQRCCLTVTLLAVKSVVSK
jgi:hypothetical protein